MGLRVTRSARKHHIGTAAILQALSNASEPIIDGDQALYIGTDNTGRELEIIVIPDDKHPGGFAVIHAMPTYYRRK